MSIWTRKNRTEADIALKMSLKTEEILLVPEKTDVEREVVVETWQRLEGSVQRLGRFWEKPAGLEGKKVTIYGNDTFAQVVAQVSMFNWFLRMIHSLLSFLSSGRKGR
jgi:hypothetical protein